MKMVLRRWVGSRGLVLLAFWLAAGTARADVGYAYALISGGASPVVSAAYSQNSANGPITVTRNATGSYRVNFSNSGIGTGWTVIASTYATSPGAYCNAGDWAGNFASVACYGPGGAAKDNDFTVLAISNTNDKNIRFAWASQPTTSSYSPLSGYGYNPSGTITITRSAVGIYQVSFQGLGGAGGTVQVSAYNSNAQCNSNGWSSSSTVNVRCFDPSGNPVDSRYNTAVIPPGATPPGLAYSYSNDSSQQNYNPTGLPANVAHVSQGAYTVTYYGLNLVPVVGGIVTITADSPSARCQVVWTTGSPLSALVVYATCYDTAGNKVDSAFEVLVLPAMGYANALMVDGTTGQLALGESINPGGATVTATRTSTGKYTVTFPNSGIGPGWVVQAWPAYGSNQCTPQSWIDGNVLVECYTPSGSPVDSTFDVLAVSNTNRESLAFAWANQPSVASYAPDSAYSYNPAGTISIARQSQGDYTVVFHGLDGSGGTVQISPNNTPNICYSGGWRVPDFTTSVLCVDQNGAPADTAFVITVISGGAAPPANVSYVWASEPTTSSYSASSQYSYSASGSVQLSRLGTGNYGSSLDGTTGVLQVTAYGTPPALCATIPNESAVQCDSVAGTPADSMYDLLLLAQPGFPLIMKIEGQTTESALVNAAFVFGAGFGIQVKDTQSHGLSDVPVLLSAPTSGPSGTFSGGASSVIVLTDSSGTATLPNFTANSIPGSYSMTISPLTATTLGTSATLSLTNLPLTSVTLTTVPAGLPVSFGGSSFAPAPQSASFAPGSPVTIAAQSPVAGAQGIQYVWQAWSDRGAISHDITVPASDTTLSTTYETQYQLTAAATPAGEGSASTAGNATYFAAGTSAGVTATPNAGYRFNHWTGNVANAQSASTTVLMTGPGTVTAHFALACNLLGGNSVTAADAGKVLGRALGQTTTNADMNSDGVVNVVDIQIVLNAALQFGCLSQ